MNGSSPIPDLHGRSPRAGSRARVGAGAGPDRRLGNRFATPFLCLLASTALAACVQTGDFGRPTQGVWNSLILPSAGAAAAAARGEPVSTYPFTDSEEELRNRSWRFLMPAKARSWFDWYVADLVRARVLPASDNPFDPSAYYAALTGRPFASPASRYRRIGEDAHADLLLIDPFGEVAKRVIDADRARLRSLAFVRDLSADQVANAAARVVENRCLIAWVRAQLYERTGSYRYALEHAFIAMPQNEAADTERVVKALDVHRRVLDGLPVPAWRQGACLPELPPPAFKPRAPLVTKG